MELANKVILITGASSGIGKELAALLSKKGAKLILVSRTKQKLEAVATELQKSNPNILAIPADVMDKLAVQQVIDQAVKKFGGIDILVNNAGVGYYGPLSSMTEETLTNLLRTNIYGPLYFIQSAVNQLKRSRGMIVNISSGLSKRALPFLGAYGGTKALLNYLSDGLRMELRGLGIKVLTYGPPATDTPFISAEARKGINGRPGMKLAKAEDVAARIVSAIAKEKREVVECGPLGIMNAIAPSFLDKMFYNAMVKPIENKG